MRTLQLATESRRKRRPTTIKVKKTKAKVNENSDILSKKAAELVLNELKEKAVLEEKKRDINQFTIKLALFIVLGLAFIYLKFTLF